jgi:hypothetical protein
VLCLPALGLRSPAGVSSVQARAPVLHIRLCIFCTLCALAAVGDSGEKSLWWVAVVDDGCPILDVLLCPILRSPCVVWCGVVWCGVVKCGVVKCGVVKCGVFFFFLTTKHLSPV